MFFQYGIVHFGPSLPAPIRACRREYSIPVGERNSLSRGRAGGPDRCLNPTFGALLINAIEGNGRRQRHRVTAKMLLRPANPLHQSAGGTLALGGLARTAASTLKPDKTAKHESE